MNILSKFKASMKELQNVFNLTVSAMLLALRVLLGYLTVLITPTIKVGFTFIPMAISGILYGPVVAGIIGGAGDILSYFLNPAGGAYFPGFTLNAILSGVIYGIFLYQKPLTLPRIILCKITVLVVVDLLLTTLWLSITTGGAFLALLGARLLKNVILLPFEVAVIYFCGKLLKLINVPKLAKSFKR